MGEYEERLLFKIFPRGYWKKVDSFHSNLHEHQEAHKEFSSLKGNITDYLRENGIEIDPKLYHFNNSTILKREYFDTDFAIIPVMGIELKIIASKENIKDTARLLRERFDLYDGGNAKSIWDCISMGRT